MCVKEDVLENLFELFPKSKVVVQKRALERRKVFMEYLEKLEKFLHYKKRKMQALQNKRLKQEKKNKLEKQIKQKRNEGIPDKHLSHLF